MPTRYAHTNLIARDWRRLATFYEEALGCARVPPERDLAGEWLDRATGLEGAHIEGIHLRLPGYDVDGPTLEIFQYGDLRERPAPRPNSPGLSHLAFAVDDVEAVAQAVFNHGGRAVGALTIREIPGVGTITFRYVADPEGNVIELQQWEQLDDLPRPGPSEVSATSEYFLCSERLGLRAWTEDDLDLALGLWGDPAVTGLIDSRGPLSEKQVRERLLHEIATERAHGVQYWPMFLLRTGEHVGCCGLRPQGPSRGVLEIGVHIRSDRWGRGYAKEAVRAVMAYAFDVLEVSTLFAGHHPHNKASRALLEKLGFVYVHDEFYAPTGLYHPSYRLTTEAYESARGASG